MTASKAAPSASFVSLFLKVLTWTGSLLYISQLLSIAQLVTCRKIVLLVPLLRFLTSLLAN
jgi:hypothetical protein